MIFITNDIYYINCRVATSIYIITSLFLLSPITIDFDLCAF